MKNFRLLIFLSLLSIQYSFSQWSSSVYPADFSYFTKVHFYNEHIVIGADYNGLLLSKDGGKNFERKFNNVIIYSLQAVSETSFFCADYKLRYAHSSANTWQNVEILNSTGDTLIKGGITQFYFFNNGRGFLTSNLTSNTRIFKTNNNGLTWNEVDSNKISIVKTIDHSRSYLGKMYIFDSTVIVRNIYSKNKLQFYGNMATLLMKLILLSFLQET